MRRKRYVLAFIIIVIIAFMTFLAFWLFKKEKYFHTPEEAIIAHLKEMKVPKDFQYEIIKEEPDPLYGVRYFVKEKSGKFTDQVTHIYYFKENDKGWYITQSGNAP